MIYFVSENKLKDFTTILGSVDIRMINPLVPTIANQYVQPRLGTYFYKFLLNSYNNQTLNQDEIDLVEIIQNAICWRVAEDIVITSSSQLTNKGPQTLSGEYSQPSSESRLGLLSRHYKQKAEHFESEIVSYLKKNGEKHPEFKSEKNSDCSNFYPKPTSGDSFDHGIYLI